MAQGRGSSAMVALLLIFFMLELHSEMAHAANYTVGDAKGWTFNVVDWPNGKNFRAGDTLVFNYSPGHHDVVVLDEAGYDACRCLPTGKCKVYRSGKDHIKLARGHNYFICNFPGHCQAGMKIAVNAA